MAKAFYIRLAAGNLRRNRQMYGPYCIATALMSGMFYIILNLIFSRSVSNLSYGGTVQAMFTVGIVVMTLFTVGYMFYLNSFLIKRRKKEFGLYAVLGMERRHVGRVIRWESVLLSCGSLLLGIVFGIVFGRLAFLILMNILDTAQGSVYTLSGWALAATILVFAGIFVLTTLYNLFQVRLANPVDLIQGGKKGEKKTRFTLPMTIIGVILLGVAYYLAISVANPAVALMGFWPAVILVIIATWLLMTGGSAFVLRRLKKNDRIYYKPGNFIAISGLIHRMKQNAAGLANICILSTMVMVTVACCASLYLGQEKILDEQHPSDISLEIRLEDRQAEAKVLRDTLSLAHRLAEEKGVEIETIEQYRSIRANMLFLDGAFVYADENGELPINLQNALEMYYAMEIIPLDSFNAVTGRTDTLAPGEVLLLSNEAVFADWKSLPIRGGELAVRETLAGTPFTDKKNSVEENTLFVVAGDAKTQQRLVDTISPRMGEPNWTTWLNINLQDPLPENGLAFAVSLRDAFRMMCDEAMAETEAGGFYRTSNIYESRLDGYGMYGGLLFLGVFFAILFLINTVLILYFKQISEGFDDCERFEILQKVGLSDEEVRSTINRQMLIVFLLPLVVALVHIAAASNMIRQMLGTFMMTDFALTMGCIVTTCAIFIIVYLCVYRLTARTYYRLVKW